MIKKSLYIFAILLALSMISAYPIKLDICKGINITNPMINISFSFYDNSTNQSYNYSYLQNISYSCNVQNMFTDSPSVNLTNYTNAYPGILFWYDNGWYFVNSTNVNVTSSYYINQDQLNAINQNITSARDSAVNACAGKTEFDSFKITSQQCANKTDMDALRAEVNVTKINDSYDNRFNIGWKMMVILAIVLSIAAIAFMAFNMRNNQ